MKPIVAIDDDSYLRHQRRRWLRWLPGAPCPRQLLTGEPLLEFVVLGDLAQDRGLTVVPHRQVPGLLAERQPVLKFGPTNPPEDRQLLTTWPGTSEWNLGNHQAISELGAYLDLGRRTWNLFLPLAEHRAFLGELFQQQGRLFIKSREKGFAALFASAEAFFATLGDLSRLGEESLDIIVSEPLSFHRIRARTPAGWITRTDEWRHYVWRRRLIHSTHAFDCDPARTDDSGREANVAAARAAMSALEDRDFATTYVLDTGTLAEGPVAVIEANDFFASGQYGRAASEAIADALAVES